MQFFLGQAPDLGLGIQIERCLIISGSPLRVPTFTPQRHDAQVPISFQHSGPAASVAPTSSRGGGSRWMRSGIRPAPATSGRLYLLMPSLIQHEHGGVQSLDSASDR